MKNNSITKAQAALQYAEQAFKSGDIDKSIGICSQILRQNPDNVGALYLAGAILFHKGSYTETIRLLSRANKLQPGNKNILLTIAKSCILIERFAEALYWLDLVYQNPPDRLDEIISASHLYLEVGNPNKALSLMKKIDIHEVTDFNFYFIFAKILRNTGHYNEAIEIINEALAIDQINFSAWIELAELRSIIQDQKSTDLALHQAENLLQDYSDEQAFRLALTYYRTGHIKECENILANIINSNERQNLKKLEIFADRCLKFGSLSRLAIFNKLSENTLKSSSRFCILQAKHFIENGDPSKAYETIKKINKDLLDPVSLSLLIECIDQLGDTEEQLIARIEYNTRASAKALPFLTEINNTKNDSCLRIGFITSHEGTNPLGDWSQLLIYLDPDKFETYCYASIIAENVNHKKIKEHAKIWRNVLEESDTQLAAIIRNDQIDILIDCDGHHKNTRLFAFSYKPAPLQITLAGTKGTGLDSINYRTTLDDNKIEYSLKCCEALLCNTSLKIEAKDIGPILRSTWETHIKNTYLLIENKKTTLSLDTYIKESNWPGAERAIKLKRELLGLGSSRFTGVAELVALEDYCKTKNLSYHKKLAAGRKPITLPVFFGDTAIESGTMEIPDIYIAEVSDAIIFADSTLILLPDHKAILDVARRDGAERFDLRATSINHVDKRFVIVSAPLGKEINHIEKGIALTGAAASNYYHWLIEIVSRLAYLDEHPEYDDWPLLISGDALTIPQHMEILKKTNQKDRPIISLQQHLPYHIDKLVVPSLLAWLPAHYIENQDIKLSDQFITEKSITYLRTKLLSKDNITTNTKNLRLYISRRKAATYRHLLNEEDLEELFMEYGFEIVHPELLPIEQQISLFSQAEVIAGPTGAGMTNILFAPDKAKIICFMPLYLREFASFSTIATIRGLSMIFVDGLPVIGSHKNHFQSDYTVDLQLTRKMLDSFL